MATQIRNYRTPQPSIGAGKTGYGGTAAPVGHNLDYVLGGGAGSPWSGQAATIIQALMQYGQLPAGMEYLFDGSQESPLFGSKWGVPRNALKELEAYWKTANASGNTVLSQLERTFKGGVRNAQEGLAARGILSSGEYPWQLRNLTQAYGQAQSQAGSEIANAIKGSGGQGAALQGLQQYVSSLGAANQQAAASPYAAAAPFQLPQVGGTTDTIKPYLNSLFGKKNTVGQPA